MKRAFANFLICLMLCIAISLAGCGNEFAKQEYNDTEKIVPIEDRYAKYNSVFNPIDGGYSLTVSNFDGRQTLFDCDNNITVIVECSQDNSNEQSGIKLVYLTSGLNRLKIVGYDCKDIDLKLFFDEP